MSRLKILSKVKILALLDEGNILRYNTIYGNVDVITPSFEQLGAVRFDTYLKLSAQLQRCKDYGWLTNCYIKGDK